MMAIGTPDKSDPSYSDGYFSAIRGERFDTDRGDDEQYAFGFDAGDRAAKLFAEAGFSRHGKGFSVKLAAPATSTGEEASRG
jgi:hypothetical protein